MEKTCLIPLCMGPAPSPIPVKEKEQESGSLPAKGQIIQHPLNAIPWTAKGHGAVQRLVNRRFVGKKRY